jgi:hypothetical protein
MNLHKSSVVFSLSCTVCGVFKIHKSSLKSVLHLNLITGRLTECRATEKEKKMVIISPWCKRSIESGIMRPASELEMGSATITHPIVLLMLKAQLCNGRTIA